MQKDNTYKILVSPEINTPEPFKGFGGFCGWPKVCLLNNGDLFVTFSAGYWHASWKTPWDVGEDFMQYMKKRFPEGLSWDAPEGGHMMWIKSKDGGKTWSKPKTFPIVPGAYGIGEVAQLKDGTMLAAAVIQTHHGWKWSDRPFDFAKDSIGRLPMKTVVLKSWDDGENWKEISRISGPFLEMVHPHAIFDGPYGGILMLSNGIPLPQGLNVKDVRRFVSVMLRSDDGGVNWDPISVIGSNDYDFEEGAAAILPDGSIGTPSRPNSIWAQSYDGGNNWEIKGQILQGEITENDHSKTLYKKGDLVVTSNGTIVLVFCGGMAGNGQVIYSRDSGKTWHKPAPDRGWIFNQMAYYPDACVLPDDSIFVVADHQGFPNKYGPYGAETVACRFRVLDPDEGEGIEILPVEGGEAIAAEASDREAENMDALITKAINSNYSKGE